MTLADARVRRVSYVVRLGCKGVAAVEGKRKEEKKSGGKERTESE